MDLDCRRLTHWFGRPGGHLYGVLRIRHAIGSPLRWVIAPILETRLMLCQDRNADFAAHRRTPTVANKWLTALFQSFTKRAKCRCNCLMSKILHPAGLEPATL